MATSQIVILICWGIFLFYWFINWTKVKPTLEQKGFNTNTLRFIIVGAAILLLLNHFVLQNAFNLPLCNWSWRGCHYGAAPPVSVQSLPLQAVSIVIAILGISVAVIARRTLAGNWSSTLDVKKGHELVTTGIYHYIRHPIYTGVLLILLATLLAFPSASELTIILVVAVGFLVRIKKEEELMTRVFPQEYPEYKKRTKALVPFIW